MPFHSRKDASKCVSMMWRAISARPLQAALDKGHISVRRAPDSGEEDGEEDAEDGGARQQQQQQQAVGPYPTKQGSTVW